MFCYCKNSLEMELTSSEDRPGRTLRDISEHEEAQKWLQCWKKWGQGATLGFVVDFRIYFDKINMMITPACTYLAWMIPE